MIKYDKFNIFLREHYLTFLFLIILSPVFISLDFSQGLRFDQFYGLYGLLKHKYPSIPISVLIISLLSICNLRGLLFNKSIQILFFLILVYMCLNLYFGIMRAAIVGFGMMFIIVSYYMFLRIINNRDAYKNFYMALSFIIIIKLLFDIYIIASFWTKDLNDYGDYDTNFLIIHNTIFITPYFISRHFLIYNLYDYFPFIYYLATALSIQNFLRKKYLILSTVLLIVSNVVIIGTASRFFIYSIYLIPFLYIFYQFTKFSLERYFYIFLFVSIAITLIVSFLDLNLSDLGLLSRYNHIHKYFGNFSLVNLILPFLNEHRIEASGSLHNELLEIFSLFGFVIVYYLFLLKKIFCNIKIEFKFISYLLIFVLIIGTLIQINISNPYVGIITGLIFAVISSGSTKIRQ